MRLSAWGAVSVGLLACGAASGALEPAGRATPVRQPAVRCLVFVENAGQMRSDVAFAASGPGRAALFGPRSWSLVLRDGKQRASVEFALDGARDAAPRGTSQTRAAYHFLRGSSAQHARTFGGIEYADAWPGVDMAFDAASSSLRYALELHPGADASAVRFRVRGASGVARTASGELTVTTGAGVVTNTAPVAWQVRDGVREPVAVAFDVSPRAADGSFSYGFALGARDAARTTYVDPEIVVAGRSFGGSDVDVVDRIAFDPNGNLYAAGYSSSADLIPQGVQSLDAQLDGPPDAVVAKFDAAGQLAYATFLGTKSQCYDIDVDASGRAVVVGGTTDPQFPVKAGPTTTFDAQGTSATFITRLAADGSSLIYSGFIPTGSQGYVSGLRIAANATGVSCVTGTILHGGFPVTSDLGVTTAQRAGFAVKVSDAGQIIYSVTLLANEQGFQYADGVAVDAAGAVHVTGRCTAGGVPAATATAFIGVAAGQPSAFVAKLAGDGTSVDHATYLGGSGLLFPGALALDGGGRAVICGHATGSVPADVGPSLVQPSGVQGGFIGRLAADGASLDYCGYLPQFSNVSGLALSPDGSAFVTGGTAAKVVRIAPDGSTSELVTSLDGYGLDVAVDPSGSIAVTHTPDSGEPSISVLTGFVPAVFVPEPVGATALTTTSVRVTWTPHGQNTGFVVERALGAAAFAVVAQPSGGTSTDDTGLQPNTLYRYRVRARREAQLSAPSAEVSVRTLSPLLLKVKKGKLADSARPARDAVAATARVSFAAGFPGGFDPSKDVFRFAIGTSFVVDVPAGDAGWKFVRGLNQWTGTVAGGTVKIAIGLPRGTLSVRATGLTLSAVPANPVEATLTLGALSATDSRTWRAPKGTKLSFP